MSPITQQQALVDAVLGRGDVQHVRGLNGIEGGASRGLQAYRGNAQGLAARALASVYPRLHESLEGFDAMAWTFWRRHPPGLGDLGHWGGALAQFLDDQVGMDPLIVDQARLGWALHEAESAADDAFEPATLSLFGTCEPQHLRLRFRAGLALLQQSGSAMLVWRSAWRGVALELDAATARFMRALLDDRNLEQALSDAGGVGAVGGVGDFDFSNWLQQALREGWLLRIEEAE